MYCVKCGVRLKEGSESCPLCQTPVWNPEKLSPRPSYPASYPEETRASRVPAAIVLTVLTLLPIAVVLAVCFNLYGRLAWGGTVIFGLGLFYVLFVLPFWFKKSHPLVFIPVDHAAAALYVLYLCLETGGRWFLSFAFPVIALSCALVLGMYCLLRYVRKGYYYIFGGFFLLLGGSMLLIEFFEHLSFGLAMFRWSPYAFAGCAVLGLMLLLIGLIPPLREAVDKRFYI